MNTINLRHINSKVIKGYPVWHPFSNVNKSYFDNINIARGDGIYLYDVNNKKYLDFSSGLWNVSLGYQNKAIKEAISNQMNKISYCSLFEHTNQVVVKNAYMLLDILPQNMKKIFFTCSGSESIELTIKIMRKYWYLKGHKKKNIIISLNHSYHGTYYGSMSVSGMEQSNIQELYPLMLGTKFFSGGVCEECIEKNNCTFACINMIEEYLKKNIDNVAGILIEPILASYGVDILSKAFLEQVKRLCDDYKLLLAIDEVATGFFRTGPAFYSYLLEIYPDIIAMGKGINSGYLPLGAVAVNEKIYRNFDEISDILNHGSTQDGNLLACASSIAAIEEYSRLNVEANVSILGRYMIETLNNSLGYHNNVKRIKGIGFLIEIELCNKINYKSTLDIENIELIKQMLKSRGLIVYNSLKGLTLLPMLIASKDEIELAVEIIEEVFRKVHF